MIFQFVVPSSSGGYYIREAGLFSSDGSLIAIARTAEQYKPQLSEGAGANIEVEVEAVIVLVQEKLEKNSKLSTPLKKLVDKLLLQKDMTALF